jgi:glycerol-3-phosphate dehydrogenase
MIPPAFGATGAAARAPARLRMWMTNARTIAEMHHKTCNKDCNPKATTAQNLQQTPRCEANHTWEKGLE